MSVGFFSASSRSSSFISGGIMGEMSVTLSSFSGTWYTVMPLGAWYLDVVMLIKHLMFSPDSPCITLYASSALPKYTCSVSRVMLKGITGGKLLRVHRSSSFAYHSFLSSIFI
ncbi:hypothetical protein SePPVgORF048 [Seal parapoxvirus]|uniref:Uncharacterized protein n=1 Tax=Seal parapoxvirus TaxID=187984 RepID=A0A1Z4CGH3_9POXV|nr:hypothetical protein CGV03_gp048 [Seal parapoxvirus]ASF89968.1 hypothetical protein SePPVgORF048 [Seal parapoxvirus]